MEWTIILFILALLFGYRELTSMKHRQILLERKIEFVCEQTGLEIEKHLGVSAKVLEAIKSGDKVKAIRLYREDTGSSLLDARNVIEELRSGK